MSESLHFHYAKRRCVKTHALSLLGTTRLLSRSEGEKSKTIAYYNVQPNIAFPQQTITIDNDQPYYHVITDNKQAGTLRSLMISEMALAGPQIAFSVFEEFREPWRTIVNEDSAAVSKTARLLECNYLMPNTNLVREFKFWYRERPAGADEAYLSSRMANHPLLRVGAPLNTCPISIDDAITMLPLIPTETLRKLYGEMLKQAGDTDDQRMTTPEATRHSQKAALERIKGRYSAQRPTPMKYSRANVFCRSYPKRIADARAGVGIIAGGGHRERMIQYLEDMNVKYQCDAIPDEKTIANSEARVPTEVSEATAATEKPEPIETKAQAPALGIVGFSQGIPCTPIHFKKGTSTITLNGQAPGEDVQCLKFRTNQGQTVDLSIESGNGNVAFSISKLVDNRDHYQFISEKKNYEILIHQTLRAIAPESYTLTLSIN